MNKNSKAVNDRRKRIKGILIKNLGGYCCCCGYDRCNGALEFHHIDPKDKKFTFGSMVSKSLQAITEEIQKCVLVCSNCHKEVHDGLIILPINAPRLSENFVLEGWKKYTVSKYSNYDFCSICGDRKLKKRKYCSLECSGISQRKVDRPDKEQLQRLIDSNTWTKMGEMYGVSDSSVRKWAKSYKLI